MVFAGRTESWRRSSQTFNPKGVPEGYRRRIAVLGFFGIVALLVAAGSALTYAKTAAPCWIIGVAVGGLCAAGLFVVWIDIWEYAGGVG